MSELDFEKSWLVKFAASLDRSVSATVKKEILEDGEKLSAHSDRQEIFAWTKRAMAQLDRLVDKAKRVEVMTACACQYPKPELDEIRKTYEAKKDIHLVHKMLQDKFESFLRHSLTLDDKLTADIIKRGWGLAGTIKHNKIIATKIPKSEYLVQYFKEKDPVKKRTIYCHCPRIRDSIMAQINISPTYCYCGAGFYKGFWEYILQRQVKVEVLKSVLKDDDVCQFAIDLE